MKKLIMLLLWGSFAGYSQEISLSGKVVDGSHQAVPFADMLLLQANDSVSYKTAQTNESGEFRFNGLAKGDYLLKLKTIGFEEYLKKITIQKDTILDIISLSEITNNLESVTITSKKPIVKRLIDRLEFGVENSSLSSNNAWEILSKTPGVMTGTSGAISIRGSQSILVTINDKKVYLSGEELKQFLENTSGEEVKSIEVITNPPAKYEAQGSAVLNIKLKKNVSQGYKGSVNTAYVQSMYPKGIVSTNQFYKGEKLSLAGRYGFGSGIYVNEGTDVVHYLKEDGSIDSRWESIMRRKSKSLAQNSYRLQASYEIDSLNTIAAGATGFIALQQEGDFTVPTFIYGGNGALDSLYVTRNNRTNPLKNKSYNMSFDHLFSEKEKVSVAADYTQYWRQERQDITSAFSLPEQNPYRTTRFISDNVQDIQLFTAQTDYSNEINGTLEAGLKFGNVKAQSGLDYKDEIAGNLVNNPNKTSVFLYDESILAGYASYNKEFGKWSLKAGLRGEYTSLEGNSVTTSEINQQRYFKLFPTFYGLYKPKEGHEIGISYGKRITRPQYSRLNPFRSYYNSYSYFMGDPKLLPTITHNLNLLYTLKNKYNFDLFYRLEKNPSMEISYQDYETNMLVYHFTNIKKDFAFGLEFNTNLTLYSFWESGIQAGLSYVEDRFQGRDGNFYKNGKPTYNTSISNRFVLTKKKDLNAELNFQYNSSSVQGTFVYSQTSSLSAAIRKKIWKENGEVYLIISDIYRGQKEKVVTDYADQYNYFKSYADTQSFRLGLRYNFGNQKLENKKKEVQTEEQQRL
ncbi:TonB-dependent receptor family protein [Flavobacterium sp. AC]|uniref:TonB-dependent receptor family protein n=1 Tax=Flavobacterium azizsancarii TaxID=2961580 RepID=A0ABT4WCI0_9FLAO|nr:outer membrane beta-barrel family protein [Flavobacterium azizsancarii]MDA6069932.1 TonB-dependent receptor family protein [Flavobacterium azizsancarii]